MSFHQLTVIVLAFVAAFGAAVPAIRAETLVALMSDKKLRYFSSTEPSDEWIKTVQITGIRQQESLQAMDFRPDGSLVVISREGTLLRTYEIDADTGTIVRTGPGISTPSATGVAFNAFAPAVYSSDLVVATDGDGLTRFRIGGGSGPSAPVTLAYDNSASDGDPVDSRAGVDPSIVGFAATNSFAGAESSALYGVDSGQDTLVEVDPSTGSMETVAQIKLASGTVVTADTRLGFDISGATGIAYLSNGTGATRNLYTVDLTTGVAEDLGEIGPVEQVGVTVLDIAALPRAELANISTRSRVGRDEEVMIAGFIVTGANSSRLIIRGIGPSLATAGATGVLGDPRLTVFDGNGAEIAANDNWKSDQEAAIAETQLAPANDLEAAYVGSFAPGAYTAVVEGRDGGTGVGLVEIYRLRD